jgi:hypothetical protein
VSGPSHAALAKHEQREAGHRWKVQPMGRSQQGHIEFIAESIIVAEKAISERYLLILIHVIL